MIENGEDHDQTDEGALAEAAWAEEAQISASATLALDGATLSQHDSNASSRLLKGEGVDVSLPTRRDINLQMWCNGEAAESGSFVSYLQIVVTTIRLWPLYKSSNGVLPVLQVKQAILRGGSAVEGLAVAPVEVPLLVESIDALILEQRDLTFGKRAQTL